jgi:hypothetical protein
MLLLLLSPLLQQWPMLLHQSLCQQILDSILVTLLKPDQIRDLV